MRRLLNPLPAWSAGAPTATTCCSSRSRADDWCDTLHFERRADGRPRATTAARPCPTTTCACAPPGCRKPRAAPPGRRHPIGTALGRQHRQRQDAASTLLALNRLWEPAARAARRPRPEAGCRRALLHRRAQRLRRGHRRAPDAAARAKAAARSPSSNRRRRSPPPRSSAARCLVREHRSCYTFRALLRAPPAGSAATICSRSRGVRTAPRWRPGRSCMALRQRAYDRLRQRGVREGRHGRRTHWRRCRRIFRRVGRMCRSLSSIRWSVGRTEPVEGSASGGSGGGVAVG